MLLRQLALVAAARPAWAYTLPPAQPRALRGGASRSSAVCMSEPELTIMMNGLPGAMGREIAADCLRRGYGLAPFCLTGPGCAGEVTVDDGRGGAPLAVQMYEPSDRDTVAKLAAEQYPEKGSLVCIDFTHPSAVNDNAEWYGACQLPFVMGTTGGAAG